MLASVELEERYVRTIYNTFATLCKPQVIPKEIFILKTIEDWEKICHVVTNQKKNEIAISMSDKVDFRRRKVIRDKEGNYIIIKRTTIQEDIKILNVQTPNKRV